MPYDLGVLWSFGKDREADLPTRRIGTELVEVIEGLRFEGLVRGRIPGDFYGVGYLCEEAFWSDLLDSLRGARVSRGGVLSAVHNQ